MNYVNYSHQDILSLLTSTKNNKRFSLKHHKVLEQIIVLNNYCTYGENKKKKKFLKIPFFWVYILAVCEMFRKFWIFYLKLVVEALKKTKEILIFDWGFYEFFLFFYIVGIGVTQNIYKIFIQFYFRPKVKLLFVSIVFFFTNWWLKFKFKFCYKCLTKPVR